MTARWRLRGAVLVVCWLVVLVVGGLVGFDPHPWRALLVGAVVVAVLGLVADSAVEPHSHWRRDHTDGEDWPARDARTAFYTRLLDSHLATRSGDQVLLDRLARLARDAHRSRHGEELDDPELRRLESASPSTLTPRELARTIDWIEEL